MLTCSFFINVHYTSFFSNNFVQDFNTIRIIEPKLDITILKKAASSLLRNKSPDSNKLFYEKKGRDYLSTCVPVTHGHSCHQDRSRFWSQQSNWSVPFSQNEIGNGPCSSDVQFLFMSIFDRLLCSSPMHEGRAFLSGWKMLRTASHTYHESNAPSFLPSEWAYNMAFFLIMGLPFCLGFLEV